MDEIEASRETKAHAFSHWLLRLAPFFLEAESNPLFATLTGKKHRPSESELLGEPRANPVLEGSETLLRFLPAVLVSLGVFLLLEETLPTVGLVLAILGVLASPFLLRKSPILDFIRAEEELGRLGAIVQMKLSPRDWAVGWTAARLFHRPVRTVAFLLGLILLYPALYLVWILSWKDFSAWQAGKYVILEIFYACVGILFLVVLATLARVGAEIASTYLDCLSLKERPGIRSQVRQVFRYFFVALLFFALGWVIPFYAGKHAGVLAATYEARLTPDEQVAWAETLTLGFPILVFFLLSCVFQVFYIRLCWDAVKGVFWESVSLHAQPPALTSPPGSSPPVAGEPSP